MNSCQQAESQNMNNDSKRSKRIASNTLVLFARMLVITCVNLYTVRWVLNGLGTTDYGIFNAVAGVVTASTCISSVLALSTQRFYSFAMGQGNKKQLIEIFTVSLHIVIALSILILVIFEIIGPWFVETHLTIPSERLNAANWVLQFSLFSFIFSLLQIPFIGAVFSNEDLGIYAIVSTADCIAKLIIAILIGKAQTDNLMFYGFAMMTEALLVMSVYIITACHRYEECRYQATQDKKLYKELFAFSGWSFYGALSGVGMTQGSIIILNIFFGPVINAAFSVANQIYNAINALSNSIVIAFRPAMIKAYAANDLSYLDRLFYFSNKAILYLLLMAGIPFIFQTENILAIWLGNYTQNMVLFSKLYVIYTICLSLHNPVTTIIQGTGHIKKYSLYVESITILSLPISWGLFKLGLQPYYIFVTMIGLCILAQLMRLKMLKKEIYLFSYKSYFIDFIGLAMVVTGIASIGIYYVQQITSNNILQILLTFATSIIIMPPLIFLIALSKREKTYIKAFAKKMTIKR